MRKEEEDNKGKKKKEEQCNTDSSAISLHDTAIATSTCCITFHELPGLCICSYEGTLNLSLYTNNTGAETHPAERQHIRARHPSAPPPSRPTYHFESRASCSGLGISLAT